MNCQEGLELMQRHIDHDLNDQETAKLMEHVGRCPDCAAVLERLVRLSRGLEQLPRVVPPYSLVDAILPELGKWDEADAEKKSDDSPASIRRRLQRRRRTWITRVSGAVALGVIVSVLLLNGPFFNPMGAHHDMASLPEASSQMKSSLSVTDQNGAVTPSADMAPEALPKSLGTDEPTGNSASDSFSVRATSGGGETEETRDIAKNRQKGEAAESPAPGVQATAAGSADAADAVPERGLIAGQEVAPAPTPTLNGPVSAFTKEAEPSEEAISPDGQWKAVVIDGDLQLFRMSDGSLVYDQAPDQGKRAGLTWNEDSTEVDYTYTDADGKTSAKALQVPELKEISR